jgi:PAS domain S-box-containing protein
MQPILPPAHVEVDAARRYVDVDDAACELLGYSRDELLQMKIDDISAPSGAHVPPMFQLYSDKGELHGIFALRRKDGEVLRIRFESAIRDGRYRATWTHWEKWNPDTE